MRAVERRRGMKSGGGLPYDAEIEYLQSDGKAYLNLGFATSLLNHNNTNFDLGFTTLTTKTFVWGGTGTNSAQLVFVSGYFRPDWAGQVSGNSPVLTHGTQYALTQTNGVLKVSTKSWNMNRTAWPSNNFFLFTKNPREASSQFTGRIHYMTITNRSTGDLIHDYIAVRKGQIGYFYDRVDGTLIGNAGTGDFTLGPDKT